MKVSTGGVVIEATLETISDGSCEIMLKGGMLSVPAPGTGFSLVEATEEERLQLSGLGYRLPEFTAEPTN